MKRLLEIYIIWKYITIHIFKIIFCLTINLLNSTLSKNDHYNM